MVSRSGGTPIRTNKVESGPDQAFTLPKGTSAAPIKLPYYGKVYTSSLKAVKQNVKFISGKTKKLPVKVYSPGVYGKIGARLLKEPDIGKPQYVNVSKNQAKTFKKIHQQHVNQTKKIIKAGTKSPNLLGLHAVGTKAALKHSQMLVKNFTKAEKGTIPSALRSLKVKLKNMWKQQ